ncbi:active regulator of SIRT1-like [Mizuhopecten yessoensis]|uniref:Active regulator of SIRT1 n=1 Tax=Mizuhopecten yessoensis TaxID=6573 RepID=A0A210QTK7_MIZYE|nr:active regulator of SIRT1-like [Mizuhopecten yessoensis]OWF52083.1 Active regulator of SIRT1 [Mizuhopecten yessoensis]
MSAAVTQQYLQLFDDDLFDGDVAATSRRPVNCKSNGTSKKGVQKRRKQMKKQQKRRQEENLVMKNKLFVKSTVEKYKLQQSEDLTIDSLRKIQEISRVCKTLSKVTQAVVDQNRGRLAKDNPPPEITQQTGTVFTDRDFDKFEQEYDFFA